MLNCNSEYPFPVLRPDTVDYKNSVFKAEITVKHDKEGYVFSSDIDASNDEIRKLVERGEAQVGIYIQCNSTWLRKIQPVNLGENKFLLSTAEVHNRVEFCPVITANQKIDDFKSQDFIEEFNGIKFSLQPGDPLAIGETKYFDAKYKDDIIRKGDPIISVTTTPDITDMCFNFENSTIIVYVPERSKKAYGEMQGIKVKYSVLSMLFYLPAITEGIRLLKESEEGSSGNDYREYMWAKTMQQSMLQIAGGDLDKYEELLKRPFQTAQKLLGGMDAAIMDLKQWVITGS